MDGSHFDTIVRRTVSAGSRRRLLSGLIGGAAAVLTGAVITSDGVGAKPGRGRGRATGKGNGRGRSNGKGQGNGNGPGNGRGRGQQKITLCHRNDEDSYHVITVAEPAREAHLRHGDVECVEDPCKIYTGTCDPTTGACGFESAIDAACADGAGICDAGGNCIVADE